MGGIGRLARGKVLFDPGEGGGVENQFPAKDFGGDVASEVVAGGAQPAGGDERSARANASWRASWICAGVVGDTNLAGNLVAQVGQFAAKPLLMGVEDAPDEEFGAGVDQFDAHFFSGCLLLIIILILILILIPMPKGIKIKIRIKNCKPPSQTGYSRRLFIEKPGWRFRGRAGNVEFYAQERY